MQKNTLAEALNKVASRTPHAGRTQMKHNSIQTSTANRRAKRFHEPLTTTQRTQSRIGKKVISGFFEPQASKQLARLAIDHDQTNEDLLREALNDLFTKYRLPPIA